MKNYANPEYKNEAVMSSDIITVSHISSTPKGNYVENVFRDKTTGDTSVQFVTSLDSILG